MSAHESVPERPWTVYEPNEEGASFGIDSKDGDSPVRYAHKGEWGGIPRRAVAEHIVRAVNAHDDLLAALEGLLRAYNLPIPSYEDGFGVEGDVRAAEDIAREAIARARGEASV